MQARGRNGQFTVKQYYVLNSCPGNIRIEIESRKPCKTPPVVITGSLDEMDVFCKQVLKGINRQRSIL